MRHQDRQRVVHAGIRVDQGRHSHGSCL
jgi:hypothetical protein